MSPLRFLGLVLAALFGAFLLLVLAFYTYGRDASWDAVFGPADLGPYDFYVPSRTGTLTAADLNPARHVAMITEPGLRVLPADRSSAVGHRPRKNFERPSVRVLKACRPRIGD